MGYRGGTQSNERIQHTYNLICLIAPNFPNISYISSVEISNGRFLRNRERGVLEKIIKHLRIKKLVQFLGNRF